MEFVYCDEHTVYKYKDGNINLDLNNYVKPNDIKQIYYKHGKTVILTHNNKIFLFGYIDKQLPIIFSMDKKIRQISMNYEELLVLFECGELKLICRKNYYSLETCNRNNNNLLFEHYFNHDTISNYEIHDIMCDVSIISIDSCYLFHIIRKKTGIYYLCANNRSYLCNESDMLCEIMNNKYYLIYLDINNDYDIESISCGNISCIVKYKNNDLAIILSELISFKFFIYTSNKEIEKYGNLKYLNNDFGNINKIKCNCNKALILTYSDKIYIIDIHSGSYKLLIENQHILNFWIFKDNIVYLARNNKLYTKNLVTLESKYLFEVPKIIIFNDNPLNLRWLPKFNSNFDTEFNSKIRFLLLYNIFLYKKYNIKIPKMLTFMIINFII